MFFLYFTDDTDVQKDTNLVKLRYRRQATSNYETSSFSSTTADPQSAVSEDSHRYYTSQVYKTPVLLNTLWNELKEDDIVNTLSDAYSTAKKVQLPLNYTFYGQSLGSVTIVTGGFLYTSEFLHQWLTATNYIAPLMANFDTAIAGYRSLILYKSYDSKFVVEWKDVFLKEQNETADEPFKFQCIVHQNGTIVFLYKNIPIPVSEISTVEHPVKIGLSDAFYVDTNISGIIRRTIYEYHTVELDQRLIEEGTVVILTPLPTCNTATDCDTCITMKTGFSCTWCPAVNRCSDGIDRHREEWLSECFGTGVSYTCPPNTTPSKFTTERSTQTLHENETTFAPQSESTSTVPINTTSTSTEALHENETTRAPQLESTRTAPIITQTTRRELYENDTTISQRPTSTATSSASTDVTSTNPPSTIKLTSPLTSTLSTSALPLDNATTSSQHTESTATVSTTTNPSSTVHSTADNQISTPNPTTPHSETTVIHASTDTTMSNLSSTVKLTTESVKSTLDPTTMLLANETTFSQRPVSTATRSAPINATATPMSSTLKLTTDSPISKGHKAGPVPFNNIIVFGVVVWAGVLDDIYD